MKKSSKKGIVCLRECTYDLYMCLCIVMVWTWFDINSCCIAILCLSKGTSYCVLSIMLIFYCVRAAIWEKSFRGYVDEMTVKRNLRESEAADRRAGVGRNGAKPRKKNERRSGGGPSRVGKPSISL